MELQQKKIEVIAYVSSALHLITNECLPEIMSGNDFSSDVIEEIKNLLFEGMLSDRLIIALPFMKSPSEELFEFYKAVLLIAKALTDNNNLFTYIAVEEVLRGKKESGFYLARWLHINNKWNELVFDNTEESLNQFFHEHPLLKADIFDLATVALSDCALPPEAMRAYAAAIKIDMDLLLLGKKPKYLLLPTMNKGGRPKSDEAAETLKNITIIQQQSNIKSIAEACRVLSDELKRSPNQPYKSPEQLQGLVKRAKNSNQNAINLLRSVNIH